MSMKERAETEIILSGGDKAGKTINELTAQSVKLNREIKNLEVGSEEWVKKTADYQKINGRLKDVREQVRGVDTAQKHLNSTLGQFIPFNSQLKQFLGTYKGISDGIKNQTMAQKALNIVTKAFPLAFLIGLFASLISYLTTTQEGMDKLRQVTLPVIQVFERLKGLLQVFGQGLVQVLSGDVVGGFRTMKEAVSGVGDAFRDGIAAGKELADLTVQIEMETNRLELAKAKLNRQIEDEKENSRDLTLSEAERNKAAQRAVELINERTRQETALIDLQIRKMELEQEANDTSRAEEFELMKLKAQREEVEAAAARERRRLNNQANADAITGEKGVTGAVKKEKDEQAAAQKQYQDMVERSERDLQKLRIALIEDDTERKRAEYAADIAAFKGSEDQKAEYARIKAQQLDAELAAIARKRMETDLAGMREEEELRRMEIEENFYNFLLSEEEREQQLYEVKRAGILSRLELIRELHGEESAEFQKHATELAKLSHDQEKKRYEDARRFAEARMELDRMGLEAFHDVVGSTLGLLDTEEDGRRKNVGAMKAFKAMQMKISYLSELQAIWETANANPANILFPGSANIIAGVKTLAASARFASGMREVMGAKYQMGGPVWGPSHASGGVPFSVRGSGVRHEMEGGEIIMTKGVYQNPTLRAAASMINSLGGGRSFAMGGPVNPLNRSVSPNDSPTSIVNNITNGDNEMTKELIQEVRTLREELSGWQRDLEVRISLQKVRKGLDTLKEVESDAGI